MERSSLEKSMERVIGACGTDRLEDALKAFLNERVQRWTKIQDLCRSFPSEIVVRRVDCIEVDGDMILADFTVSFTDLQMAVCCEVQPGVEQSVGAKVAIDRRSGDHDLQIGVFWDTNNDGY